MLFVLISGGIDLSFTAIATITGYTVAVLLLSRGDQLNILVVFLIAGVMGTLLGMINACDHLFLQDPADHRHHRHTERLLRAADRDHAGEMAVRLSAGLATSSS